MNFYVIENSDENSDSVTMLKAESLTVYEVNTYGVGHVNNYLNNISSSGGTAFDSNGYGAMAYYTSDTCGYPNGSWVSTGCSTNYDMSEIKYVVDAWAIDKLKEDDLQEDSLGYRIRLITLDELITKLDYEIINNGSAIYGQKGENIPDWLYNNNYGYWTMSSYEDSTSQVWDVSSNGNLNGTIVNHYHYNNVVRPVVTIKKSAI